MISLSLLLSLIVINFCIFLFLKWKDIDIRLPKWTNPIFGLIFIAGIIFIFWQESEINNDLIKRTWPSTTGEILKSEIVGNRAIRNEIIYQYEVDNKTFQAKSDYNIPGFGSKNYRRKTARILKNENPVGSEVKVYYDPEYPEHSTLRYGPYWSNYMILGFGSILFSIGSFGLSWQIIKFDFKKSINKAN